MTEMNGVYCSSRPMRIGAATPRKSSGYQQQYSSQGGYASNGAPGQGPQSEGDSSNTTIFVGGLDPNVTDEDLRQPFSQYGEIASVKIPVGKGCGFVQFANSLGQIMAINGVGHTMEGKFMMVMGMLFRHQMTQACTLQQLRPMGLTLCMAATNNK
ncbi:hypothetical protein CISIN_1g029152mg [Citrus sinensis]|uniref:RRM domain-containing protein n=1 Tax=Citrus sinensis TaxID=2711 RepID=A0A067DA79_CITSI|nr:hypothetical protein CISIN_1g029152mg [Citrus sinensis]